MNNLRAVTVALCGCLLAVGARESEGGASKDSLVIAATSPSLTIEECRSLGPRALPALEHTLSDWDQQERWGQTIRTAGCIGAPESHRIIHDFIWKRFDGPIDGFTAGAMRQAVLALGMIPPSIDPAALRDLVAGTDTTYWQALPWLDSTTLPLYPEGFSLTDEDITKSKRSTARMLAVCAMYALQWDETGVADSVYGAWPKNGNRLASSGTIEEFRAVNAEVRRLGLLGYLKVGRERVAKEAEKH